jgi:hypothetical protein
MTFWALPTSTWKMSPAFSRDPVNAEKLGSIEATESNMQITLFLCGTRYDRNSNGELIAELYKQAGGEIYIFAGAGSDEMSKSDYDPFSEKHPKGWKNPLSIAKDTAEGLGMDYNVGCLMTYLASQEGQKGPGLPDKINMVGWSRGAVTCIKMANAIQDQYGTKIEVNIFAIDPVPGPGNFTDDAVRVPTCVKRCTTIIMENGQSTGFTASRLFLGSNNSTNAKIYPFPGSHGSCVQSRDQIPNEPMHVIYFLAEKFLAKCGTPVKAVHNYTDRDLIELYGKMVKDTPKYMALTQDKGRRLLAGTQSYYIMNNHIQDYGYFINWHHKKLFSGKFPALMYQGDVRSLTWMEKNAPQALEKYKAAMVSVLKQFPLTRESLEMLDYILSTYG